VPLRGVDGHPLSPAAGSEHVGFHPVLRARRERGEEGAQRGPPATTSRLIVPLALALSFIAHLAFLTPAVILGRASPFDAPPANVITVDIVPPEEIPQPADEPQPAETAAKDPAPPAESPPATSPPAMSPPATSPPAPQQPPPALPAASARPNRGVMREPPGQAMAPLQSMLPPPPFVPPPAAEPDDPAAGPFGMPLTMPDGAVGHSFDSQAVERADVTNDVVAAFGNHLKACAKLPADIAPGVAAAAVRVAVRVYLNPDGTLATGLPANPGLLKVSGEGGGELSLSVAAALRKCQPYKMLPPDRYPEWRTLDITFTPPRRGIDGMLTNKKP
jgi:hypothetical protein